MSSEDYASLCGFEVELPQLLPNGRLRLSTQGLVVGRSHYCYEKALWTKSHHLDPTTSGPSQFRGYTETLSIPLAQVVKK